MGPFELSGRRRILPRHRCPFSSPPWPVPTRFTATLLRGSPAPPRAMRQAAEGLGFAPERKASARPGTCMTHRIHGADRDFGPHAPGPIVKGLPSGPRARGVAGRLASGRANRSGHWRLRALLDGPFSVDVSGACVKRNRSIMDKSGRQFASAPGALFQEHDSPQTGRGQARSLPPRRLGGGQPRSPLRPRFAPVSHPEMPPWWRQAGHPWI